MPFKVRFKLIGFMGDVDRFPCHFDYKIGDEFSYDGGKFDGNICQGLLFNMVPILRAVMYTGNRTVQGTVTRYSGISVKDVSKKKYDGIGFSPLKIPLPGSDARLLQFLPAKPPTEPLRGWGFPCIDCRTSAFFLAEPVDLAKGGDCLPYYNREMAILEKIKKSQGLTSKQILKKFTIWERTEIYPPLNLNNLELMLDELAQVNYIEIKSGKFSKLRYYC